MDTRSYLRTRARVSPLAFGLALAFGSAVASPRGDALPGTDLDAAIPRWLSPVDKAVFRKQLERLAAHTPADVPITSIPVSNCDDSGAGSLRDAVNSAVDGDTIDLTALDCSTITLTSGAIVVPVDSLTIQGPSALLLTIDGGYSDRVFWHLGFGELTIADVSVAHGRKYLNDGGTGDAAGGCIFSTGDVTLDHAWAKYCKAGSNDSSATVRGGAVYAENGVFMNGSIVTGSTAYTVGTTASRGGGVYTPGDLLVLYSTISGNTATTTGGGVQVGSSHGTPGGYGRIKYSTITANTQRTTGYVLGGGGVYLTGDAYISHSTISGNSGCRGAGVYFIDAGNATGPAAIYSSTVSGNSGTYCGVNSGAGGVQSFNANMVIMDSTIAFNTYDDNRTENKYGAGVRLANANSLVLENTIIAGNMVRNLSSPDFLPDDIGGHEGASVAGANNLVYMTDILLPAGTILLTDPSLRALDANGGTTATHMPNFGSPVIDFGNNVSGAAVDQRGPGYPRILGAQPDIGAVEFDLSDEIFANGFD
jgi:hypothetical protein